MTCYFCKCGSCKVLDSREGATYHFNFTAVFKETQIIGLNH
jgi:transcriptional regulator NrdR family protein